MLALTPPTMVQTKMPHVVRPPSSDLPALRAFYFKLDCGTIIGNGRPGF